MGAVVSVDGFMADDNDGVGPLFDWLGNGDVAWSFPGSDGEFRTTQASADFMLDVYGDMAANVIGRRVFDMTNGWNGKPAAGEHVFVGLYDMTDADAAQLDAWEGADTGLYRKLRVRVHTLDGDKLCWVYVLDGYEGGLPSARYLGVLADAAEAAGAPEDYLRELRTRPCRSTGP